jgi:hypothetical protein
LRQYSRYRRIAGIPCPGLRGILMHRDDIRLRDSGERIAAPSFYEGQAFLYGLVQELSFRAAEIREARYLH